jgi:hemerythrin-like domain-containing protein
MGQPWINRPRVTSVFEREIARVSRSSWWSLADARSRPQDETRGVKTTYSVNWCTGEGAAVAGLLEVTPDALVFTPADGGAVAEISLAGIAGVRRYSSTVQLERQSAEPIRIESAAASVVGTRLAAVIERAERLRSLCAEHDRIDQELGRLRVAVARLPELGDAREHEVSLLATDLMRRIVHHAHVEEEDLFCAVERPLGCGPLVDALVFDHQAIEDEARELVRIDPGDRARFACVFNRLDALVTTHIAKEEAIVFPLLESSAISRSSSVAPSSRGQYRLDGVPSAVAAAPTRLG